MAQNYIESGDQFQYTVPTSTTIESGEVVIAGNLRGVSLSKGTEDEQIIVKRVGVFNLDKEAEDIDQGDALYYKTSTKSVTKTATGNTPIGYAHETKLTADGTINVLLDSGLGFTVPLGSLAQEGATNGQVIKWDNTAGTWEAGNDLDT